MSQSTKPHAHGPPIPVLYVQHFPEQHHASATTPQTTHPTARAGRLTSACAWCRDARRKAVNHAHHHPSPARRKSNDGRLPKLHPGNKIHSHSHERARGDVPNLMRVESRCRLCLREICSRHDLPGLAFFYGVEYPTLRITHPLPGWCW